jgi:mono/diheme cytochrome c family protein
MRRSFTLLFALAFLFLLVFTRCKHNPDMIINPGDNCDTTHVTYAGSVFPIFNQYCVYCHSGVSPFAGIDLTSYKDVSAIAQSGLLGGAVSHSPNFSYMPKYSKNLSDCQVRQIEIWIRDTTFTPPPALPIRDPDTVYFENDVMPIFYSSCGKSGCHDVTASKKVRLDSYAALAASHVVVPFDTANSLLYYMITLSDPTRAMPKSPNVRLNSGQIETIRKWILQGALDLRCEENCDTANVTFDGTIWPEIVENNCFGCHNGSTAFGGIHLENKSQVAAAALLPAGQPGSLWGAVNHTYGNFPMPKNQARLTECKIAQLRNWIKDGTP